MPNETDLGDGKKRVEADAGLAKEPQVDGTSWCYAAVERMVKLAYGVEVGTQKEIAKKFVTEVLQRPTFEEINDMWDALKGEQPDTSYDAAVERATDWAAENTYGNISYNGLSPTVKKGSDIVDNNALLKDSIAGDHLAIRGSDNHYTVIYGYETDADGKITNLREYDPLSGGGDKTTGLPGVAGDDVVLLG